MMLPISKPDPSLGSATLHGVDGWGLESFSRDEDFYVDVEGLTSVRVIGRYVYERQNPVTRKHEHREVQRVLEGWSLPFKAKKDEQYGRA